METPYDLLVANPFEVEDRVHVSHVEPARANVGHCDEGKGEREKRERGGRRRGEEKATKNLSIKKAKARRS